MKKMPNLNSEAWEEYHEAKPLLGRIFGANARFVCMATVKVDEPTKLVHSPSQG